MGKAERRKGIEAEREFAKLVGGTRVPLSGSAGGEFAGDVMWPGVGRGEVKRRADGFVQLYRWLEGRDFVAMRADRKAWLVVLPIEKMLQLLKGGCYDGWQD